MNDPQEKLLSRGHYENQQIHSKRAQFAPLCSFCSLSLYYTARLSSTCLSLLPADCTSVLGRTLPFISANTFENALQIEKIARVLDGAIFWRSCGTARNARKNAQKNTSDVERGCLSYVPYDSRACSMELRRPVALSRWMQIAWPNDFTVWVVAHA